MDEIMLYQAKSAGLQPTQKMHPTKKEYLHFSQTAKWFTREQCTRYFHGKVERDGRTERVLMELCNQSQLVTRWWLWKDQKIRIYSCKRRGRGRENLNLIQHGLRATEAIIRLYRSDTRGAMLADKDYSGKPNMPDGAIRYPNGRELLIEYSSANNLRSFLKRKIEKYEEWLDEKKTVLCVCDSHEETLKRYLSNYHPNGWFYFTSWQKFIQVPYGQQLSAPIYFWDSDPTPRRLGEDHE